MAATRSARVTAVKVSFSLAFISSSPQIKNLQLRKASNKFSRTSASALPPPCSLLVSSLPPSSVSDLLFT
eukprot:768492-Hanusia_phi.AAC.3